VTDKRGNRIRGLTAADFEIRDNGVVQPITNFVEYSEVEDRRPGLSSEPGQAAGQEPGQAGRLSSTETPKREKHTLVVFVDRMILPPRQAEEIIASLKKVLHETIRAGDSAAVVSYRYALKVEQEFTGDLAKLDKACDSLKTLFDRVGEDPESVAIRNAYWQEILDEDAAAGGTPAVASPILSGYEAARRAKIDLRRKFSAMSVLANVMASVEGRKSLLALTDRLSQYAGGEYFAGGMVPPENQTELDMLEQREKFISDANAAGVSVYTIYPIGLITVPVASVEEGPRRNIYRFDRAIDTQKMAKGNNILMNETTSLSEIAQKTGGVTGSGFTDVFKVVDTMRNDFGSYYSLAFRAPPKASTHRIRVTTKNRSYVVRARREFLEKSDLMQMTDRVTSSLYQPQRPMSLPIDVQVLAVTKKGRRYHIPVVLRIPAAALTTIPGHKGQSGSFRVYAAAGGPLGIMSDVHEKSQPFTIPPEATDTATKIFTYTLEMVTDARADRIVVAAYDELSRQYGIMRVSLDTLPKGQ
jgi:VWFA-related protein